MGGTAGSEGVDCEEEGEGKVMRVYCRWGEKLFERSQASRNSKPGLTRQHDESSARGVADTEMEDGDRSSEMADKSGMRKRRDIWST